MIEVETLRILHECTPTAHLSYCILANRNTVIIVNINVMIANIKDEMKCRKILIYRGIYRYIITINNQYQLNSMYMDNMNIPIEVFVKPCKLQLNKSIESTPAAVLPLPCSLLIQKLRQSSSDSYFQKCSYKYCFR